MFKMSSRETNCEGYLAPFVLAPDIDVHTGASFAGSIWTSPGFHVNHMSTFSCQITGIDMSS